MRIGKPFARAISAEMPEVEAKSELPEFRNSSELLLPWLNTQVIFVPSGANSSSIHPKLRITSAGGE